MKVSLYKSLKFRMPLIVLAGVIPLISLALFYASDRAAKTIRKEATENVTLKTQMLADSVLRWEESNKVALANLSVQPDVISMNPADQKPILEALARKYNHFYLAMTMSKDGWNVARNDNKKLKYYGDRKYFQGAIEGNEVTYQAIISRTIGKPALMISTPIRDNSVVVGVAAVGTDLEELSRQVGQLKFGETGYVFIVNELGQVLAHPDSNLVSGKQLTNLSNFPPVKHVLEFGTQNEFSFEDDSGVEWLSWSEPLNSGWSVIVVQEKSDFLNSQKEFINLASFIAIVAICGVSVVIFILADRLISPIGELTSGAIAISNGKLDRQVGIKREDELGILAKSFNRMTVQLRNAFYDLEQRNNQLKNAKEVAEQARVTAESANQAKDRFLANISHELRTPLNGILGYTKLVLADGKLDPTNCEYLEVVEKSGIHLLNIINDILDISQSQFNKIELNPNELELSSFLNETVALVSMLAREKGLELTVNTDSLPQYVLADRKRLKQVLINLLGNGIKFTRKGQVNLKVSAIGSVQDINSSPKQKIRFEVIDTGIGITQTQLNKVFQPFEQVGNIKSRADGTGLGLSISKRLVELMDGELKVKSKFGLGSVFWFDIILPIVEKDDRRVDKQELNDQIITYHQEIAEDRAVKPKILVVDDKEINRNLLVAILKPKGFNVFTANNGEEMLRLTAKVKPDLILLDLFMPVKTGFTSAKELRQNPDFKDIPIIVVTASTITKEVGGYLDCEAVLHKPIDEKKLLALLDEYLATNARESLQDVV